MIRRLSLHHLCAMDVNATVLVRAAAQAGFDHVCIFTEVPVGITLKVPLVTAS